MFRKSFFFCLLISCLAFGQTEDKKEQPKMIYTEKAKFPGGEEVFSAELHKMINGYIDLRQYAVNGTFYFTFIIDEKGKIKNLNIIPKVKNSDMFIEDMMFAMKKIKKRWNPALQNGQPVESKYILSINFTSDHYDHDD